MSKAQFRNCGNKRRFTSKHEALAAVADRKLGVYVCPVCQGFHLTSQVKRAPAVKRTRTVEKPVLEHPWVSQLRNLSQDERLQ